MNTFYHHSVQSPKLMIIINKWPLELYYMKSIDVEYQACNQGESKWNAKDDIRLLSLHKLHQNKWSIIHESLPYKSINEIKNHFYSVLRKGLKKIIEKSHQFDGILDTMQCFYVAKHVSEHMRHPNKKIKKNYLKTLIVSSKLNLEKVASFLDLIVKSIPDLSSLIFSEAGMQDFIDKRSPQNMKLMRVLPTLPFSNLEMQNNSLSNEDKLCFLRSWVSIIKNEILNDK